MANKPTAEDIGNDRAYRIEKIYKEKGAKDAEEALRQDYLGTTSDDQSRKILAAERQKLEKDDPANNFLKHASLVWAEPLSQGELVGEGTESPMVMGLDRMKIRSYQEKKGGNQEDQFNSLMADSVDKQYDELNSGHFWRSVFSRTIGVMSEDLQSKENVFEANRTSKPANQIALEPAGYKDRQADAESERRAKEESERKVKEEAERKAKEESERKAKEESERKAKEESERKAKEESERKAKEEAERKSKEEAERKPKEEAERKAKEEGERKAKEETERKAKEETERKAKEESELKAKEEAERKAKEEAERKAKEEAERKAKEEAEHKAKEETERKAKIYTTQKGEGYWDIAARELGYTSLDDNKSLRQRRHELNQHTSAEDKKKIFTHMQQLQKGNGYKHLNPGDVIKH